MTIARRPILAGFVLAVLGAAALAAEFRMEEALYGLVGKIKTQPGRRADLIALLSGGTADMPGCIAYLIAEDLKDSDGIWITEVWKNRQFHADSLKLPAVQDAIAKGRPLIVGFETHVETRPVGGVPR